MSNDNVVDKIYLALELTKIRYNDNNDRTKLDIDVINTFNFYVTKLTGIEDLSIINKIKDENKTLHAIVDDLKERYKDVVPRSVLHNIIDKIYDNSIDMEPRVSTVLIDYINNIMNKC